MTPPKTLKSGLRTLVLGGVTCPSFGTRKAVLGLCAGLLVLAGCGEGEGVAEDAVVSAYVAAPLCAEAEAELAEGGSRAGSVRVRAVCLAAVERGRRVDLAQVGANARRASEDSTTIAYVEQTGPAGRFSEPIVDSAGIAWIEAATGAKAMQRVLDAVAEADSSSLRSSVEESLSGS